MKMRKMSRFWMMSVVSLSLGMTLLWVTPTKAGPLSITQINWSTLSSYLGTLEALPVIDYFDFSPPTPGFDGAVMSAVYKGAGNASGLFVYLYQLKIYKDSSADFISGIAFNTFTPKPPTTVDGIQVFTVPDPPILFGQANPNSAPERVIWGTGQISTNLTLYRDDQDTSQDPPGDEDPPYEHQVSFLWGFFHRSSPILVPSNPKDGGSDLRNPYVYTPTPEPSVTVLMSLGVLGLLGIRRRRFLSS